MKNSTFRFKKFVIDQSNCAMKVNTDGVLLGSIAGKGLTPRILDIGTGTGVIALMLAQRFPESIIDAVEIDENAFKTSKLNFENSVYSNRLTNNHSSFQDFFQKDSVSKYDLIVSNPPYFLNSLQSENQSKMLARHSSDSLFFDLINLSSEKLSEDGRLSLILPVEIAAYVEVLASEKQLKLHQKVSVKSFPDSVPHREIVTYGFKKLDIEVSSIIIYESPKKYSEQYSELLKDFLTIF